MLQLSREGAGYPGKLIPGMDCERIHYFPQYLPCAAGGR